MKHPDYRGRLCSTPALRTEAPASREGVMATEADTCRKWITPKLQAAGWEDEPHSIAEQRAFTDGRIVVRGTTTQRRKGKRADYLLRYTRDFPLAVVEASQGKPTRSNGLPRTRTTTRAIMNRDFESDIPRFSP